MSLVVRVIAPTGRDTELITRVLQQNGLIAESSSDIHALLRLANEEPIGPLLIAEEALNPTLIQQLGEFIQHQPAWSDLPLLILTSGGRETLRSHQMESERSPLGSPVLLERPIRTATLVSSVRAALRARQRQYEVRDALRERDRVLEELSLERETLQVMLDNLPVGVLFAKASGEIVLSNRSFARILRYPVLPAKIDSREPLIGFHLDGRRVRDDEYPLPRAMQSGHVIHPEEYLCQRGDGTTAWISFAAAPIFNVHGVVTGGVAAISDIDHQKQAETALVRSEKLAAVGRLAASISHEINNPLESVTNLLYLARHAKELTKEVKLFLDMADEELRRVSQIVSQTLRFHRQSTRPRAISTEELLEPALGLYKGRLANSHIQLKLEYRGAGMVTCYEGEIRQVLNNLIGNAIEAMRTGGRLIVRTSRTRCLREGMVYVRISIADNGHGIPSATLRHIFEPFYTTKGESGTGLGLWISQSIVEKHHGRLQVSSSTNKRRSGTVFSLLLPAMLVN